MTVEDQLRLLMLLVRLLSESLQQLRIRHILALRRLIIALEVCDAVFDVELCFRHVNRFVDLPKFIVLREGFAAERTVLERVVRLALHQVVVEAPVVVIMGEGSTVVERAVEDQQQGAVLVVLDGRPRAVDVFRLVTVQRIYLLHEGTGYLFC